MALMAPPGLQVSALAHQRLDVAADILAVVQQAHAQEAQWLQMAHPPPLLQTVQDIQASSHFHLGALQGDHIVGVLVVAPDDEPGQLNIHTLVVLPSAQRQGVGRRLVQDALRRGPGVVFSVSAATANAPAMALYQAQGFVPYRQGALGSGQLPITKLRRAAQPADATFADRSLSAPEPEPAPAPAQQP